MNGVPKMSVIRKVCSEMHLRIKKLFLLNLKVPPEIQKTERFSNRKFVNTDFSKQAFRDFLQIYNSYRFAINKEYVVKNQKIKVVQN